MVAKPSSPHDNALTSYITLRRLVGVFGIALPFALPIGTWIRSRTTFESSISAYYYTEMRDVFVGVMCAFGVFLLAYQFGWIDNWLGNVAGLAAIAVAFFPVAPDLAATGWVYGAGVVHYVAAAVFFGCLAAFAIFRFPLRRDDVPQRDRKLVYRVCGGVIVVCLVVALAKFLVEVNRSDLPGVVGEIPLFWLESVAIVAFGVSWFTTGTDLFPRRTSPSPAEPRAEVAPLV